MKRSVLIVGVALMGLASSQSYSYENMGYGAGSSCGSWTKDIAGDSVLHYQAQSWVLGFVSGAGFSGAELSATADNEALIAFVTQYCQRNPLNSVARAAGRLVLELKKE